MLDARRAELADLRVRIEQDVRSAVLDVQAAGERGKPQIVRDLTIQAGRAPKVWRGSYRLGVLRRLNRT